MHLFKVGKYILIIAIFILPVYLYSQDNSIYKLLLSGSLEELRSACRIRGLSDKGDVIEIKRKLINYERGKNKEARIIDKQTLMEKGIFLKNADFLKMYKDTNGDEILFLFGSVNVVYLERKIKADIVRINTTKKIVIGEGNIKYNDSKNIYYAESFYYNMNSDSGIFFNAKTKLGNYVYRGNNIKKLSNQDKYIGDDISLTTCEIKNPHYIIKADKLYYYDSNYVLIKNMKLYFGQDDMVELPYYFKNLQEPSVKTTLYFRKRSGIVAQNSYYPVKSVRDYLLLMGDYYERLGIYGGGRWYDERGSQKTDILASLALSKNIYYYDEVSENWSPLGPPQSDRYEISRELRYHVGAYKMKKWSNNQLEVSLGWVKDPYYIYDFERRSQQFDIMKLISEAEDDYPRKDNGFSWYLKDNYSTGHFSCSIDNHINYIPQRNLSEELAYLPDYYEYRLYSAILPGLSVLYSNKLFENSRLSLIRGALYTTSGGYSHNLYFDEYGKLSKELHEGSGLFKISNDFTISNYIKMNYNLGVGFNAQNHLNPETDDRISDNQNTLAYGEFFNGITFGQDNIYLKTNYQVKYKFAGPRDYYQFGNFRENLLSLETFLRLWLFENSCKTVYDLKPTYDWDHNRYKSVKLTLDRFYPLVNYTSFTPTSNLLLTNTLIFEIASSSFKLNNFALKYSNNSINFLSRDLDIIWDVSWNHNFSDPIVDALTSNYTMKCEIIPTLNIYVGFYSRNDSLWRYIPSVAKENGVSSLNPVIDLLKSFNFFSTKDRKESNFKLKALSIGLTHDLHEWELKFDYTGRREISYDKDRYVWNNTYTISIGLKKIKNVNFNTQFYNSR